MSVNINPKGPKTGFKHLNCFASNDSNCSGKISREHIISQSVLRQLEHNNKINVAGLKWQTKDKFDSIPLSGLASKILCERHNNALSPLDTSIGKFFRALVEVERSFIEGPKKTDIPEWVFSGDDLQRWMLKFLIGLTFSGNWEGNIKPECVDLLYGRHSWPHGWGFYWLNQPSQARYHSNSLIWEAACEPGTNTIILVKFFICGMTFGLCFGTPDYPNVFGTSKPDALIFRSLSHERKIILNWKPPLTHQLVVLDRIGTRFSPPPDWRKSEKMIIK